MSDKTINVDTLRIDIASAEKVAVEAIQKIIDKYPDVKFYSESVMKMYNQFDIKLTPTFRRW